MYVLFVCVSELRVAETPSQETRGAPRGGCISYVYHKYVYRSYVWLQPVVRQVSGARVRYVLETGHACRVLSRASAAGRGGTGNTEHNVRDRTRRLLCATVVRGPARPLRRPACGTAPVKFVAVFAIRPAFSRDHARSEFDHLRARRGVCVVGRLVDQPQPELAQRRRLVLEVDRVVPVEPLPVPAEGAHA